MNKYHFDVIIILSTQRHMELRHLAVTQDRRLHGEPCLAYKLLNAPQSYRPGRWSLNFVKYCYPNLQQHTFKTPATNGSTFEHLLSPTYRSLTYDLFPVKHRF